MRIFTDLKEAKSEITRDLSRALVQPSSRVQSKTEESQVHEAVGYSYILNGRAFPVHPFALITIGLKLIPIWKQWELVGGPGTMSRWFTAELKDRLTGNDGKPGRADAYHPELKKYMVDGIADYTYKERLPVNWPSRVAHQLYSVPDNRRVYLPIYWREDFGCVLEPRRVPCTLGYSFRYRVTEDGAPHLEVHLLQRSVDFNKFWLSDVAFAFYFGQAVQQLLVTKDHQFATLRHQDITVIHHILSLHSFLQDEGEIF